MTDEQELRTSELGAALRRIAALADSAGLEKPTLERGSSVPSRFYRALAVASLVGGLTVTAAATAGLLSRDEVDQFARDASIPRSVAASALQDQRRLPALDARLRIEVPDVYAGLWVAEDGVTPTIGIAAPQSPELLRIASSAAKAAGLTAIPEIRWGLRSTIAALERQQEAIQARLDSVNRADSDQLEVEPDIRRNRLILHVPIAPSAHHERVVETLQAGATVRISVEIGTSSATYLVRRPGQEVSPSTPDRRSR